MSNYSINPLTQPNFSATQGTTAFDFTNSVDNFNLQNQYQPWGNNFPDIQTGPGFDTPTDNFGQRNFSSRQPLNNNINTNVNDTNFGLLNAAQGPPNTSGNFTNMDMNLDLDDDDFNFENTKPGMFGKENGFGSGQGFFSKIGKGGEGFMGKFGTGEGKIAKAFGGGGDDEGGGEGFDFGALGKGIQQMGANMMAGNSNFQYSGYGQQNRGRY